MGHLPLTPSPRCDIVGSMEATARRPDRSTPNCYFTSLHVNGIRCFTSAKLGLSTRAGRPARWTILLGDNGTGKTSLLRALAILSADLSRVAPAGQAPNWVPEGRVWDTRDRMWVRVDARASGGPGSEHRSYEGFREAFFTAETVATPSLAPKAPLGRRARWRVAWQADSPMSGPHYATERGSASMLCCGYGATRRTAEPGARLDPRTPATASLFFEDVALRSPEDWLLEIDHAAYSERVEGSAAARKVPVKQRLVELLTEGTVTGISFLREAQEAPSHLVLAHTPYGVIPLRELSLGCHSLLAWSTDLMRRLCERYPKSTKPFDEPAVVLIDEIDLHLHPSWQRMLIDRLAHCFPNVQFIVTAHSPLVVQSASAARANVVVLRREEDHVVIDNSPRSVRNWRVDQILTSDLFGLQSPRPAHLDSLLEERRGILAKPRLTPTDRLRVASIEKKIGRLPTGRTLEEIDAMDLIMRAAARLRRQGK